MNGKGTAKDLYEKGVKASFEQWGAAVGDYLSGTTTAAAYVIYYRQQYRRSKAR